MILNCLLGFNIPIENGVEPRFGKSECIFPSLFIKYILFSAFEIIPNFVSPSEKLNTIGGSVISVEK